MKKYVLAIAALVISQPLFAAVVGHFRLEDGHTDWQHVANWSSGIFIILLLFSVITLFFSRRETRQYNLELTAIRNELEQRVQERTATLDHSNQLLQRSNELLEGEIAQHKETTNRLRSSEAYITDILSSMPLMLIGLDEGGNITQWNQKAEDITGITPDQAKGHNLWQVYPSITISPEQVTQAQTKNQPITIKHSQRGQYHFDITIYPLQEQRKSGAVILIDDVTQHILAANMLIQKDKMSSMGEIASTMAHDINAPLQRILVDLKTAHDYLDTSTTPRARTTEGNNPELTTLLSDATKQSQQVLAIIDNLLNFSHSRGGEKQYTNITDIIDHTLTLANNVISDPAGLKFRDIRIEKSYDSNLPEIPCYISELQQAFLSLFRHACHSTAGVQHHQGYQPTIKIQVIECYEALWIKIQHNGLGISSDEQKSIFEPFFTNATADEEYEIGKRLSFSYFIITEQHRGQLAITSDINVGTTFHIQLPLT